MTGLPVLPYSGKAGTNDTRVSIQQKA